MYLIPLYSDAHQSFLHGTKTSPVFAYDKIIKENVGNIKVYDTWISQLSHSHTFNSRFSLNHPSAVADQLLLPQPLILMCAGLLCNR